MLIAPRQLSSFWKVRPQGVVHVGAHKAEELEDYSTFRFGPVIWIEAQPHLVNLLKDIVVSPSSVIQALVWDHDNLAMVLNVTNNGQSSSVFDLGSHKYDHPEVEVQETLTMTTSRLDSILPSGLQHDFLNLDIQGAEFQALTSLGSLLERFNYVYTEVNKADVYRGIKRVEDIDDFLLSFGFIRVATVWTAASWGDALYIKKDRALRDFGSVYGLWLRVAVYSVLILVKKSIPMVVLRSLSRARALISPSKAR